MTDAQFATIVTGAVTLGGSFIAMMRWAVNRIVTALDANTKSNTDVAVAMARFEVKLDEVRADVTPLERRPERPGGYGPGPPRRSG